MLATLCQANVIIRFCSPNGCTWAESHVRMRFIVGKTRTRKSTRRMRSNDAPTPTTPQWNTTVARIEMKKENIAMAEAGRFFESSSAATFACAEMLLTIEGQMLSTTRTEARSEEHTSELQSLRHLVC